MSNITKQPENWYTLTREAAAKQLGVDPAQGLSGSEATQRLQKYGQNVLTEGKKEPYWKRFLLQYKDYMRIVLTVAAVASLLVGEYTTALLLFLITAGNAWMALHQESKADDSVAAAVAPRFPVARPRKTPSCLSSASRSTGTPGQGTDGHFSVSIAMWRGRVRKTVSTSRSTWRDDNPLATIRSDTMARSVRPANATPQRENGWRKTSSSAANRARNPAPRASISVPSTSKRIRCIPRYSSIGPIVREVSRPVNPVHFGEYCRQPAHIPN